MSEMKILRRVVVKGAGPWSRRWWDGWFFRPRWVRPIEIFLLTSDGTELMRSNGHENEFLIGAKDRLDIHFPAAWPELIAEAISAASGETLQ